MALEENFAAEIEAAVESVHVAQLEDEGLAGDDNTEPEREADVDGSEGDGGVTQEAENESVVNEDPSDDPGDQGGDSELGDEVGEAEAGSRLSDSVIEAAIREGLSFDQAREFGSDATLIQVTNSLRGAREATALASAGRTRGEAGPEASGDGSIESLLAKIPELDPEEYSAEAIATIGALRDAVLRQQESIRGTQSQIEEAFAASANAARREVSVWFDSEVDKLGDSFAEALGKGPYESLPPGSAQLEKRNEIAQQTAVLLAGYEAVGQTPPPREEVFQSAARAVLHKEFATISERSVQGKLAKRRGQHISRVSGKKAQPTMSPEEEAAAELDKRYG